MRSTGLRCLALATGMVAFACGGDDAGPATQMDTGIDFTSGSATEPADGDTGPKLDVGGASSPTADDGGKIDGCKKVDVILAVDNSGSMSEEHEALRGPVFDSFPQTLLAINDGIDDFHLAVIDACPKPAYFHDTGASGACNYSTGANYMISSSVELAAEFACVSDFSANGYMGEADMCIDAGKFGDDDEQPGLTAAEAVADAAGEGANAGFLRDDALLFVVTITDEDEALIDVNATDEIFDRIVAAKGGDINQIVYLGIAGGSFCDGPYGSAEDAVQARELVSRFGERGVFWDLCMGDLETAFEQVIEDNVDSACQDFVPQG